MNEKIQVIFSETLQKKFSTKIQIKFPQLLIGEKTNNIFFNLLIRSVRSAILFIAF